ncbi:MAG: DUF378 domain-containing protein [Candidatus Pacearchaeota archaeon]
MVRNIADWITAVLLIVGGLNWGLVGLFNLNIVEKLFGSIAWLQKTIYVLVGLAALYTIFYLIREQ